MSRRGLRGARWVRLSILVRLLNRAMGGALLLHAGPPRAASEWAKDQTDHIMCEGRPRITSAIVFARSVWKLWKHYNRHPAAAVGLI